MTASLTPRSNGRDDANPTGKKASPIQRRSPRRPEDESPGLGGGSGDDRSTILVVDDDFRFARAIVAELEDRGFDVLCANDGNAGLALAIVKNPDLIVLDTRMPRRSGYLVLEHLRTITGHLTPVIMMSENEGQRHRTYAKMLGALDFLAKPLEAHKIADRVEDIIEVTVSSATTASR